MATSFAITLGAGSSMTQDEKVFFQQLGARIAALRKDQGMTQVQLAEILGLTQQMVASYEVGRRRVPASLLPQIAETLAVSFEELIGKKDVQPAKRGPASKLQQQIERIQRLPRAKQRFVIEMLDTVLAQASR
ncbi:MAG: helix-turn-helix domain-containing protein [Pseudomonadota bacterium]|nr:helix-turn-helix domain-containing protein [Pseudomonadota bacterium]